MRDINTSWLLDIVQEASKIALRHFGQTEGTLKADSSWVTQADLDVETYLRSQLETKRRYSR